MDAHTATHDEHHPTPGLYLKIAIILFVLTALEVTAFEIGDKPTYILHATITPLVVPILLVLSAAKFALVAMFYMHLKQDSKLFSNLFVWPLVLAAGLAVALMVLIRLWIQASY
jgi:caa(3)-type oxidase subunit IV